MASRQSAVAPIKNDSSSASSPASSSTSSSSTSSPSTPASSSSPNTAAIPSNTPEGHRLPPLLAPDAPYFNTQIINLPIDKHLQIWKPRSREGRAWAAFLDRLEQSPGFARLYWGKVVDIELLQGMTQVHVVRDTMQQHHDYLKSDDWKAALKQLAPLLDTTTTDQQTIIRHGVFAHQSPNPRALGPNTPFSGTAIYKVTDPYGFQGAWQLWSTIIINTPGCTGVTGGWLIDETHHGAAYSFLVYVGWETMELHHDHHMTKEYMRNRVILDQCNTGYREYGHVKFLAERKRKGDTAKI